MAKYIASKQIKPSKANDVMDFVGIGDAVWNFISSVYKSNWDALHTDNKSNTLRRKIAAKFTPKTQTAPKKPAKETPKSTLASIEKIPPPIPAKSQKEINVISKYFKNKQMEITNPGNSKLYAQASKQSTSISDIIKIKNMFLSIGAKKIDQINKIVKGSPKPKHQINMTTKGPSYKQVIFPMSSDNRDRFMKNSAIHIANLNRNLNNVKSEVSVNVIYPDPAGITIVTNKISQASNLTIIEKYVKNSENIDSSQVDTPHPPQSKSYLKIIGIPYFPNGNLQDCLNASDVKTIIKQNHIFNNVTLTSKPRVIKVSPKSDMAIVWIDIWDAQSSAKAKSLINRCFNVRSFIATIRGANTNPGVPQCKNCWRWGHLTFSCKIQGSKCVKCNSPHKSENHCKFGWCCKANEKLNPPRLETKKGEPCPHSFKCLNCQGEHQADSVQYSLWKHCFNREWQQKKYVEICKNRIKSIRSTGSAELHQ